MTAPLQHPLAGGRYDENGQRIEDTPPVAPAPPSEPEE